MNTLGVAGSVPYDHLKSGVGNPPGSISSVNVLGGGVGVGGNVYGGGGISVTPLARKVGLGGAGGSFTDSMYF